MSNKQDAMGYLQLDDDSVPDGSIKCRKIVVPPCC